MAKVRWGSLIKSIISGSVLTSDRFVRRLPIVAVLVILALVYMYVGFMVQRRYSYLSRLENEITQLKTIQITTSAERQRLTRRENIQRLIATYQLDVQQGADPPRVIKKRSSGN